MGVLRVSGADRDRTGDPLVANQVLSQLSYRPSSLNSNGGEDADKEGAQTQWFGLRYTKLLPETATELSP